MMYPLKFKKVFIEKVWGGRNFETKLNMDLPADKKIGESWEISSHHNGMSIVENGFLKGKTLEEIYNKYGAELVGEKIYKKYNKKFPLLIKYLDVNDRLSIQVHPNDELALKKHNEFGKSESWYIIDATEDALLIMGMKKGITKEKFLEKAKNNDFSDMFETIKVKKGDLIDINPGMVHATLKGSILLAEIQQNSDITYRIYDFDREEKGIKRELHIEDAVEAINFDKKAIIIDTEMKENEKIKKIISKEYYTIYKIKLNNEIINDLSKESMIIYSILDGEGYIEYFNIDGKTEKIYIRKGETLLIPVNLKVELNGKKLEILKTIIE